MKWTALPPDIRSGNARDLFEKLGFLAASRVIHDSINAPLVVFDPGAFEAILDHLRAGPGELGGLLLGRAYSLPYDTIHGYAFLTVVSGAVPSREFTNTEFSLKMGTELWSSASDALNKGSLVIGWYHSHPSLGAFFSTIDRATQKAFFNHPYSLGVVIDPVRGEQKCFAGPDCNEIDVKWPPDLDNRVPIHIIRNIRSV